MEEETVGIEDCCGLRHGVVGLKELASAMVCSWGSCSCECCKEKFGK